MKYKALAISFLLLLSIIAYVPFTIANQPPPVAWVPELSVVPSLTNYTAPCKVSTIFPIDVYLWNFNASGSGDNGKYPTHGGTGVGIYAFDFVFVYDNVSGISLVNVATHIPWDAGKYFLVKNESVVIDATHLGWHFAVTAYGNATLDPSLELTSFYASLITFSFHVDDEPCWPNVWTTDFTINNTKLSSDGTIPIPITNYEIENGTYIIHSSQPDMELTSSFSPANITEKCVSKNFTVSVMLTNVEKVYGFAFKLEWNTTYLESNIQCFSIGSLFPPPYETLIEDFNATAGTAWIQVVRPCEKATVTAHEDVIAATFCFHDIFVQPNASNPIIQYNYNSKIEIDDAYIYAKCPAPIIYHMWANPPTTYTGFTADSEGVGLHFTPEATATDDGLGNLLVTIWEPTYVWGFNGAQLFITAGTTMTGYGYETVGSHIGIVGASYYNGTQWAAKDDTATGPGYFNFTLVPGGITFKIPYAKIKGYLGQPLTLKFYWYYEGGAPESLYEKTVTYSQQLLINVGDPLWYIWKPNIYDLNLDCNVDMGDLSALLKVYGSTTSNWAGLWAPTNVVDIFDFVVVAKHVGTDP